MGWFFWSTWSQTKSLLESGSKMSKKIKDTPGNIANLWGEFKKSQRGQLPEEFLRERFNEIIEKEEMAKRLEQPSIFKQ